MPRPVFPVVRLPYDRPDRVVRVLDAVRRELAAAGRQPVAMTAREPEKDPQLQAAAVDVQHMQAAACGDEAAVDDRTAVDRVTVGVRECTLTPKPRPEIMVTAGGVAARNAAFLDGPQNRGPAPADVASCCGSSGGGPYLIVPPVNITAEISRPPQYA